MLINIFASINTLIYTCIYTYTGNYDFGISRIIKSLEPYDKKLGTDTWYYAKRCFLALAESLAKHMLSLQDSTYEEIKRFLEAAERHGGSILTVVVSGREDEKNDPAKTNVSYEARRLKNLFMNK